MSHFSISLRRAALVAFVATAFGGCRTERCHDPPCPYVYPLELQGQRASDSADLFFGPQPVYRPDSISFYSLLPRDSTELLYRRIPALTFPGDSIIVVDAYNLPPAVYMRLGADDVDTFTFQYRVLEVTECCGTTYIPASVRYNAGPELPWPTGIIELRK